MDPLEISVPIGQLWAVFFLRVESLHWLIKVQILRSEKQCKNTTEIQKYRGKQVERWNLHSAVLLKQIETSSFQNVEDGIRSKYWSSHTEKSSIDLFHLPTTLRQARRYLFIVLVCWISFLGFGCGLVGFICFYFCFWTFTLFRWLGFWQVHVLLFFISPSLEAIEGMKQLSLCCLALLRSQLIALPSVFQGLVLPGTHTDSI